MSEKCWCMHCHKMTGSKDVHFMVKNVRGRKVKFMKSRCVVCDTKKSKIVSNEGSGSRSGRSRGRSHKKSRSHKRSKRSSRK